MLEEDIILSEDAMDAVLDLEDAMSDLASGIATVLRHEASIIEWR